MVHASVGMVVAMIKVKNMPVRALLSALPQPPPPTRTLSRAGVAVPGAFFWSDY